MGSESKNDELLEEVLTLEQENNKMLHSMRRSMIWSRITSILYWVIIIGASVGAFYFIQPYLNKVIGLYDSVLGIQQKIK